MNSLISLLLRIYQQQQYSMNEHITKGCSPKKAKKCDIERQANLKRLMTHYQNNTMTKEDCLFGCLQNLSN